MNTHTFSKEVYVRRRNQLKASMQSGLILFAGNEESSMNYKDNWYAFRQDSTYLYYFGLDVAGLMAIIDVDKNEEIIFGNELSMDDIVWTGKLPTVKEMAAGVGIQQTKPLNDLASTLKQAVESKREIHWLPPYRPENAIKLSTWLQQTIAAITEKASLKLIHAIYKQRAYKEAIEVEELNKAVIVTEEMHRVAIQSVRPGMKEYELVAKVEEVARAANGRISYGTILTKNGQVLHNHYYGNTLQEGDIVLCDAGAEISSHYGGDLTRTFPVSKKFSTQQKDIYNIVHDSFKSAIAQLKPGNKFMDIHLHACGKLVDGLKQLGLMKGNTADAVAQGAHAMFFQCGLGHMMGLDIHDMEDYGEIHIGYGAGVTRSTQFGIKSLRLARALEPGFVLTVEPGIYIIPELIDMWKTENKFADFINYAELEKWKSFGGVRVEDNFLITENGYRQLGNGLVTKAEDIEALR